MKSLTDAIRPTIFIEPQKLRDHLGIDLTIASETFQHTGSFKFRAAYNLALNVPNQTIITASSGNFGQALAYACKLLGKQCTVVMPSTSAVVKIDAVRGYGATVNLIDTTIVGRTERVAQLAAEMPEAYIASPYDDQFVIDGNATLGVELRDKQFDAVVVPVGGGGLISGLCNALDCDVYGAEPLVANDAARSLATGELVINEAEPLTIADGARTLSLGKLNWAIIRDRVAGIFEVSEQSISLSVRLLFELANLKCEPTSGLSLAAVVDNLGAFANKRVCIVVTGANVDPTLYADLLTGSA